MSESDDGGPGRREVAHRVFAAEFDDAEFSYSESDEERAPNYVVTPTGARVNRLFAVGVLTELEQVNEEVLRARIVDPTGPFVVYAGQYQPEALAFLEAATPPLFVAVTGKARTFEPEDGDRVFTSIRPESISEVDAETRDRWVVQAAQHTVDRIGRLAAAKESGLSGDSLQSALTAAGVGESDADGAALALDYYDTTGDYLQALRDLALNAARVVAGQRDEAGTLSRSPGDGTDDALSALSTVALEAPADHGDTEATAATSDAGTETAGSSAPADVDEADPVSGGSEPTGTDGITSADEPDEEPVTPESEEIPSKETEQESASEPTDEPSEAGAETVDDSSASTSDGADEGSSGTLGDFDSSSGLDDSDTDEEVGEFDTEFELDEDEREEIEEEYGTDFQSGTEVDDAGEADIETPDPEELAEAEPTDSDQTDTAVTADAGGAADQAAESDAETGTAAGSDGADATEAEAETGNDDVDAEAVDLEDAVMDAMTDLNDGSGADREAVITDVVDRYGADRAAVEDAIQDALMGGRCYEPDDGKLTPI